MAILEKVNASGKIFLVHTEVGTGENKQLLIRMAIGGTNTQVRFCRSLLNSVDLE
jgi:hypothetical protein